MRLRKLTAPSIELKPDRCGLVDLFMAQARRIKSSFLSSKGEPSRATLRKSLPPLAKGKIGDAATKLMIALLPMILLTGTPSAIFG